MKSKILKSSVFSLMLLLFCLMCSASASAAGYVTQGDFTYYVSGNYAAVTKYDGSGSNVVVPSKVGSASVINIADKAFWSVKTMKSLSLPSTIQSIGKAAFNECTGLTKLVLPSKLYSIGESAFWYCTNLKAVYIPPSVKSIASNAFTGCNELTAYVIPSSYAEKFIKAQDTVSLGYRYASSVKLAASKATVQLGYSPKVKYAVYPANVYNNKVVFASSDTSVFTVSSSGVITPKKCGTATLTVVTADGSNKKAQAVITVVPKSIPAPVQSSSFVDGYTISWEKSLGATGYGVYKYSSSENKWVLVSKTTQLSYSVNRLTAGSVDYYRILPFTTVNGKYYKSAATPMMKAYVLTPGKVDNVKTKSSSSAIQITWTAAPNATGYQLYRKNEATSSYTYLGKTQKLTATFRNLKANSKYVFAIRAYMLYEGKTIVATEFVDNITVYTTPDSVKSLSVDPDSISSTGARVTWDKLKGVSGYELYSYDKAAKNKYTLIAKLPHEAITGYTIDSLKSGQAMNLVIRAYINSDVTVYGPLSSVVTLTAATMPESRKDAFDGFISALNTSKASENNFYLIKTTEVSNLSGSYTEACKDILNTIAHTNVSKHYFENGIESSTALPIGSYIQPYNLPTKLAFTDVKSCDYTVDGNGYKVTVVLAEEQLPATVNSQIAPVIDWGVVGGQHKGFAIRYCLYEGTVIQAKVHNGRIDDMTISMPISFSFNVSSNEYTFAETITHNYIFGW